MFSGKPSLASLAIAQKCEEVILNMDIVHMKQLKSYCISTS